jgi:hypothetical protein
VSAPLADGTVTRVSVTAEHIAAGIPRDCRECPIAVALLAAFPDAIRVDVDPEAARLYAPEGHYRAAVPPEATVFIVAFDDELPVEPFAFNLIWRLR